MVRASLLVALLALTANSSRNVDAVRRNLEARYRHASTLRASFYERYSDGKGGGAAESGTVYFSRPGRMRWEYESPEQKLFLVDGTNVWFYVPADRTASRAKMPESSDWRTPLALLAGKADLSRFCSSIAIADSSNERDPVPDDRPTGAGNTVLRCMPRNNSADPGEQIREVLLEVDAESRLVRVVIRQAGKLETEFRFGNWEENLPIPETKFHFVPPPGVAVVDEATLAGSLH
jgi:outer membrane lipoprotein carrier protein